MVKWISWLFRTMVSVFCWLLRFSNDIKAFCFADKLEIAKRGNWYPAFWNSTVQVLSFFFVLLSTETKTRKSEMKRKGEQLKGQKGEQYKIRKIGDNWR